MSCRVFVVRTDAGLWSLWLETRHKNDAGLGLAIALADGHPRECANPVLDPRACATALVVGWLPERPFAAHRAWADKFFDAEEDDEEAPPVNDSLDFVLRVLDDAYVAAYLDVVPSRDEIEDLFDPDYDVVEDAAGSDSDGDEVILISPKRSSHSPVEVV